jgi:hypothetical protein
MAPPPRPSLSEQRGAKRRRLEDRSVRSESLLSEEFNTGTPIGGTPYVNGRSEDTPSRLGEDGDEDDTRRYYDPEQPEEERQRVLLKMRRTTRDFVGMCISDRCPTLSRY